MHDKRRETIKETIKKMFSITEDTASHDEIKDRLISGGKVTGTNMCVMICAMIIASVGLNKNSTAVIIGAMLISPLMGSILVIAYGVESADSYIVRRHLIGLVFQIVVSVLTSTIYFYISPIKETTPELLARTDPSAYDIIIALAGGIAGIIGQTRKDKSNNIIPGAAISTAIMPPLCTCGYSIANKRWHMLAGASYLFLVNAYFIFLGSAMILGVLKIPKVREITEKEWKRLKIRMFRNTIIIALPSILIGLSMSK